MMRYLFAALLLLGAIALYACAAPSFVYTLYPASTVCGSITLPKA